MKSEYYYFKLVLFIFTVQLICETDFQSNVVGDTNSRWCLCRVSRENGSW